MPNPASRRLGRKQMHHSRISLSTVEGLSAEDIDAAGLNDWRKLAQALHGRWATDDLSAAAAFLADAMTAPTTSSRPDFARHGSSLTRHVRWKVARYRGRRRRRSPDQRCRPTPRLAARPSAVLQVEIGLDSAHIPLEGQFWSALLNGHSGNFEHGEVVDADSRFPNMWFQSTDAAPDATSAVPPRRVGCPRDSRAADQCAPWPPAVR